MKKFGDLVSRYFWFTPVELRDFVLLVLVFAFQWSFTQWGTVSFDAVAGLRNLLLALVLVGVSVFAHHAAQRLVGFGYGYRVEHRVSLSGLLVGLVALLLSNGRLLVFAASSMRVHFLPYHRLGRFRYGPSLEQIGIVALAGPVAGVILSFVAYLLSPALFSGFFSFNLLFAFYSMLPIPPLDGFHVFVGARTGLLGSFVYLFTVFAIIGFFLAYFLGGFGIFWSIVAAVVAGFVGWFVFDVLAR